MSILGIAHTVISVVALLVAAVSLSKDGAINPFSKLGKQYGILTVIACVSSFGLSSSGHFNPGHALAILILLLLGVAWLLGKKKNPISQYVVLFCTSTTVFLSLVPAVNETLSRLPIGHPLADGPTSPIVQNSLKVLLVLYLTGLTIQMFRLKMMLKQK
ncbi:hypothetical protein [Niastella sp. OAS944]|uniref:hypothetical protein n=1 Tax=Niastella sp. OAS944 TaxID=2664089 RepID=UPI0035C83605|nr:hypothetical protein [Chitinophagaceae bacterium OAS944]